MHLKLVKAYVRTFKVPEVIHALKSLGAPRLTAIDVMELGDEVSSNQLEISGELDTTYTTMVKLELVCNEDCVPKVKDVILKTARTGYKGDGIIAVSPIEEAVSVRTGKDEF